MPQEAEAQSAPSVAQQTTATNSSGPAQSVSIIVSTFQSVQPIVQPVADRAVTIRPSSQSITPTVQSTIGAGTAGTLYWANTVHSGVLAGTLICGVHDGLRLLLDSGAAYHVCPKDFGLEFALDDSQDTLDELPILHAVNGKRLCIYGSRCVCLSY